MKKIIIIVALLAVSSLILAACSPGGAQISLETEKFDFGGVPNGGVVYREISIENTGTSDLEISSISTSCGCIEATLEPTVISPGNKGVLTLRFDAGFHGPDVTGDVVREVYLDTNDNSQPQAVVQFTANILPRENK